MRCSFLKFVVITLLALSVLPASGADTQPPSSPSDTASQQITNQYTLIRTDTITKHPGNTIRFSPDEKYLGSAAGPRIKLYDTENYDLVRQMEEPGEGNGMDFSPDGKLVALGSGDISAEYSTLPIPFLGGPYISSLGWVVVFNTETGKTVTKIKQDPRLGLGYMNHFAWGHKTRVTNVDFSPTEQLVASGTGDNEDFNQVIVSNAETGKMLASVPGEKAKFYPDGEKLLVWSRNVNEWTIWDVDELIEGYYGLQTPARWFTLCCYFWPGFIKKIDPKESKLTDDNYPQYNYHPFFKKKELRFLQSIQENIKLQKVSSNQLQTIKTLEYLESPPPSKYHDPQPNHDHTLKRYTDFHFCAKKDFLFGRKFWARYTDRLIMWNLDSGDIVYNGVLDGKYEITPITTPKDCKSLIVKKGFFDKPGNQLEIHQLKRIRD